MKHSFTKYLFPVKIKNKWGFIDHEGNVVIKPTYDGASSFKEGLACVKMADSINFINTEGSELISWNCYQHAEPFFNGMAKVGKDGLCGYIDKTGTEIIAPQYDFKDCRAFSEDRLAVRSNEKWGYVDKLGNVVINHLFDECSWFKEGLAWVELQGKKGYIDTYGNWAIPLSNQFHLLKDFSEGLAAVAVDVGDRMFQRDSMYYFTEKGSYEDTTNYRFGYINLKGEMVIEPQFLYAEYFREGFAVVNREPINYGYINPTGEFAIAPTYESAYSFSEGLAAVRTPDSRTLKGKFVPGDFLYINHKNETVVKPGIYPDGTVNFFCNGLVKIRDTYWNNKNEQVWPRVKPKEGFEDFTFYIRGEKMKPKSSKAFEEIIHDAHFDEEDGTLIKFKNENEKYEAVLVPYSDDWFGHFIEAVLEDSKPKEVKLIDFEADTNLLKSLMKQIKESKGKMKFVLGEITEDGDVNNPEYFLVSKKFYEAIHKTP
jgi:hypothetical protein